VVLGLIRARRTGSVVFDFPETVLDEAWKMTQGGAQASDGSTGVLPGPAVSGAEALSEVIRNVDVLRKDSYCYYKDTELLRKFVSRPPANFCLDASPVQRSERQRDLTEAVGHEQSLMALLPFVKNQEA
jgi:ribosomal protein S18